MSDIQQPKGEGSHTAGEGRFTYTITPREKHVGGGWRLQLLDNGEEVGGGVFPVTDECTIEDAFGDAWYEGEGWLGSRPALDEVMIDTETAGTTPGSAILSIGAVMFGPAGLGASFYAPILLQSCTGAGLTIDPKTITWWMNQSDQARAAAFRPDAAPLPQVLLDFSNWFIAQRAKRPWCQGANFDVPLLDAAYKACGIVPPWQFWNVRDTRTLFELAGVKVDRSKGTYHNALDDAKAQAKAAVEAMRRLAQQADWKAAAECLQEEVKQLREVVATAAAGLTPTDEQVRDEQTKFEAAIRAIFGFSDSDFEKDEKGYKYAATLDMWNGWMAYAERRLHETFEDYLRLLARMSNAARDVLAERRRQVEKEGRTAEHDDKYITGDLAKAAGCYALQAGNVYSEYPGSTRNSPPLWWPWPADWWKPEDARSNLVRAAALNLAEIERIDRAALSASQSIVGDGGAA